jgi:hypothetical protein
MAIQDKATLASSINSLFPDNILGEITPADIRQYLADILDSNPLQSTAHVDDNLATIALANTDIDENAPRNAIFAGDMEYDLPAVVTVQSGVRLAIVREPNSAVTLDPAGVDLIVGPITKAEPGLWLIQADPENLRWIVVFAAFTTPFVTQGWGYYVDGSAGQTITTTPSKMLIDGTAPVSETGHLPPAIRASGNLWDVSTSFMTPVSIGDSYSVRIDLTIVDESANPNTLTLILDIGGAAGITIPVIDRIAGLGKTPPYTISTTSAVFTLDTFVANGGQLFLATDTGTVDIEDAAVLITRVSGP